MAKDEEELWGKEYVRIAKEGSLFWGKDEISIAKEVGVLWGKDDRFDCLGFMTHQSLYVI